MKNIIQEKAQLRNELKKLRVKLSSSHTKKNPQIIDNIYNFISCSCKSDEDVVACFWPLEGEVDLRPLMLKLFQDRYEIALPRTPVKGEPLRFHAWHPKASMVKGRYNTSHPDTEIVNPTIILVPLMAFDRSGNRLGYGGGYYDRTLQLFSQAQPIGVAFSYQEVKSIPTEEFDHKLSIIITEQEIIKIKGL